ncbi:FAD-linked sulfhydryl oxidase ALR isoform X1 [Phymastichus coffea]|uniref:FAD-linked sulfhydryl oxidase ALR isoform X1 n=2 Tax=Phymastichus coffea TaxID=108790 RepID=UPI00273BA9E7|nr:FAD-linked sulfhydryl oxidase ALR isoform X1 [Phymastichus coffea]
MSTMEPRKPCRTCSDFKSWAKMQKQAMDAEKESEQEKSKTDNKNIVETTVDARKDCPLDRDSLGSNTWSFLHTMAAYYPKNPSTEQRKDMKTFFHLLSQFYPCHICAGDLQEQLKVSPPRTDSRHQLSQWLCEIHNEVNIKLGKPIFDCKLVNQRWRDGWLDGSCD